jgi:hypothetical protein
MRKIKANSPEVALSDYEMIRRHNPYGWSGLKYLRQYDDEYYAFYVTKPKANNYPIYKIASC